LSVRPEVRQDGPDDPRVAAVGGSYGGGLAMLLAGYDKRVDAIVPEITWNDLARSFLPESTGGAPVDGVFKKQWAGLFFGSGSGGPTGAGGSGGADSSGSGAGGGSGTAGAGGGFPGATGRRGATDPQCGRFARDVCQA